VDLEGLAKAWLATHGQKAILGTAAKWLKGRAIDLATPIGRTILGAREDGWTLGGHAADDTAGSSKFNWRRWKPGRASDPAGHGKALRALLKDADVTIKSVAANRFDMLARILADSLDRGDTVDELTERLRPVLRNPEWARTVAITETVRGIQSAAMAKYRELGVTKVGWKTSADEDVCGTCLANEAAGLIDIDDRFPSGDAHPPQHPHCLCALVV
jgi:hypothetical protein